MNEFSLQARVLHRPAYKLDVCFNPAVHLNITNRSERAHDPPDTGFQFERIYVGFQRKLWRVKHFQKGSLSLVKTTLLLRFLNGVKDLEFAMKCSRFHKRYCEPR